MQLQRDAEALVAQREALARARALAGDTEPVVDQEALDREEEVRRAAAIRERQAARRALQVSIDVPSCLHGFVLLTIGIAMRDRHHERLHRGLASRVAVGGVRKSDVRRPTPTPSPTSPSPDVHQSEPSARPRRV